jgi:hypothetical protein
MQNPLIMTIILTLTAVVLVLFAIRRWPLRIVRRTLVCPVRNAAADVGFARSEVSFGTLVVTDIQSCSLFGDQPPACGKNCLPPR